MTRRLTSAFVLTCLSLNTMAQDTSHNQGFMESSGKIRVVMVVCLIILIGLILYLVRLDRRISKLEKK